MAIPTKRSAIAISAAATSAMLILTAFTFSGSSGGVESQTETVYRESNVERGDITVGVSESATATLLTHDIKLDYNAVIETLNFKPGQSVKKGDVLATLSLDNVQDELKDARISYQEAVIALNDAKYDVEKNTESAANTYKDSKLGSKYADETYEMSIKRLENAVGKAKENVAEIELEIRTYTTLLRYIGSYDENYLLYTDAKTYYEECQEDVEFYEKEIAKLDKKSDNYQTELARLKSNLENAKEELAAARLEYEDAADDFSEKYDTDLTDEDDIKDARSDALKRLEDAQFELEEAEYNLKINTTNAEQELEDAVAKSDNADKTYNKTVEQLQNSVAGKSLKVTTAADTVNELEEILTKTEIVSPCDGIVTSVSFVAGDEVSKNNVIMVISDTSNVYTYVTIAQDDIANITIGQAASLVMDAFEAESFEGVVDSITTTPARSASGTASYSVKIQAKGEVSKIYEGMTGTATLITKQQKDVLYVSNRCVYEKDGESYVKVKEDDGTLTETAVHTGFSDGRNVEITNGLTEGQIVVIESQVNSSK